MTRRRGTRGDHTPGGYHRNGPGPHGALVARIKANHAVRLRAQGVTYRAIAQACWVCIREGTVAWPVPHPPECTHEYEALYYDHSGARKAVTLALEEEYGRSAATREQLRQQQLASIDALKRTAMPRAIGGDMEAARVAVKLLEREAKLYGVDAPTRVTVTGELDRQIEELMGMMEDEVRQSREASG